MTGRGSLPDLQDFSGRWRVSRVIRDRLTGRDGSFDGEARFTPDPEGLAYAETGTLRLAEAPPLQAERRYLWCAAPGGIAVRFADGRPFHVIDRSDPGAEAIHDCPPDLYRVRYDFAAWPDWQAIWRVTGPRKDYEMTSRYARP